MTVPTRKCFLVQTMWNKYKIHNRWIFCSKLIHSYLPRIHFWSQYFFLFFCNQSRVYIEIRFMLSFTLKFFFTKRMHDALLHVVNVFYMHALRCAYFYFCFSLSFCLRLCERSKHRKINKNKNKRKEERFQSW